MQTILGNHDLHLLALHYGYGKLKRADTISDILNAPDRKQLIDWLLRQPLYRQQDNYVMVHAGIWPEWTCDQAQLLAQEVETVLQNTPEHFFPKCMAINLFAGTIISVAMRDCVLSLTALPGCVH